MSVHVPNETFGPLGATCKCEYPVVEGIERQGGKATRFHRPSRRQRYDVAMRLVRASGFERAREAVVAAIEAYRTGSGGYQLNNTFRFLVTRG
jgi:hypothetical protein